MEKPWGPCIDPPRRRDYRGKTFANRYRKVKGEGKHRVIWRALWGPIPRRMVVMHLCDNPGCINPDHLNLGTQAANVEDCISKGRGNRKGRPGLSDEAAVSAMARMLVNEDRGQIAADLNTSRQALNDLFCMRTKRVLFGYGSGG